MRRSVAVLATVALVHAPAAMGWTWPVDGPVLRPFALGNDPYAAGQHRGIDIGGAPGTTVRAGAGGTVTFAGTVPAGGRTVTVHTPSGLSVTHLELGTIGVVRGTEVAEGDALGTIGPAEHVHLGVRLAGDPHGYLDPIQFLPARTSSPARADAGGAAVVQPDPPGTGEPASVDRAAVAVSPKSPQLESAPVMEAAGHAVEPKATQAAAEAAEPAPRSSDVGTASTVPTPEPRATAPVPAQKLDSGHPDATIVAPSVARPRASPGATVRPRSKSTDPSRDAQRPPTSRPLRRADSQAPPAFGAAVARARPRAELGRAQQSAPTVPPAVRRELSHESERPTHLARPASAERAPGTWKLVSGLVLGLLALAVLARAAARRRRRCRRSEPRPVSVPAAGSACARRAVRPQQLIHPCVRAGEPGWLVSGAGSRAMPSRPLPRPRRRVPAAVAA